MGTAAVVSWRWKSNGASPTPASRRRCTGSTRSLNKASPCRPGGRIALPEQCAQLGQYLFRIKPEEASLVQPRSVEDQMAKAQLHVGPKLFDLLVGIPGYDPAAC